MPVLSACSSAVSLQAEGLSFTEDQLFPYADGTGEGLYESPGGTKKKKRKA